MNETTVMMEFVRSASGRDDRARLSRRQGGAPVTHADDLDAAGYDLRWLLRIVPALLVAMAPSH